MTREVIDEILADVGLEPIHEEDTQTLRTKSLADVIRHIVKKAS